MNTETRNKLSEVLPGRVRFGVPLAEMTSYRLGGDAWAVAEPDTPGELKAVMTCIRSQNLAWFLLGGGSNVLFDDDGFRGVVIRLGKGWADIQKIEESGRFSLVRAGAGAPTANLVAASRKMGLSGLEFLAGIPGSIGGALAMNAGAHGGEIIQAVESITIFNSELEKEILEADRIEAGYRYLELPRGAVITGAVFRLENADAAQVENYIREVLKRRSAAQPKGLSCAGSVFKNPEGESAGRLIDSAGLKGLTRGGAWVAREHANFIVHDGRATSRDIRDLMALVAGAVKEKYGMVLEPEIKVVDKHGKVGWSWPE